MQQVTQSLADFLTQRLDEDEAVARAVEWAEDDWPIVVNEWVWPHHFSAAAHIARHDPARVLADVAAKRKIVEMHHPIDPCDAHDGATQKTVNCDTLRALASMYADHPEFDPAWR